MVLAWCAKAKCDNTLAGNHVCVGTRHLMGARGGAGVLAHTGQQCREGFAGWHEGTTGADAGRSQPM